MHRTKISSRVNDRKTRQFVCDSGEVSDGRSAFSPSRKNRGPHAGRHSTTGYRTKGPSLLPRGGEVYDCPSRSQIACSAACKRSPTLLRGNQLLQEYVISPEAKSRGRRRPGRRWVGERRPVARRQLVGGYSASSSVSRYIHCARETSRAKLATCARIQRTTILPSSSDFCNCSFIQRGTLREGTRAMKLTYRPSSRLG